MPPNRHLSANDKLRLKFLKEYQKELVKQVKEKRKLRRIEERNDATRLREQASYRNNNPLTNISLSIYKTDYPITPSPNSYASPAVNNNNKSEDSNISSNNVSETNSSILLIEEYINMIKDSNMLPIPLHQNSSTYLVQEKFNDFMHKWRPFRQPF